MIVELYYNKKLIQKLESHDEALKKAGELIDKGKNYKKFKIVVKTNKKLENDI